MNNINKLLLLFGFLIRYKRLWITKRLEKLIRYSEPDKNMKTLFIWPEGVFSGYTYNEITLLKKTLGDKEF